MEGKVKGSISFVLEGGLVGVKESVSGCEREC